MKNVQSEDTHPFWSTHKQTSNRIDRKPCFAAIYTKECLIQNTTIHIHSKNAPLVNKLTSYSPSPPSQSFTMCIIPDCFHRPVLLTPPPFFTMCLIPDLFGDYPNIVECVSFVSVLVA